MLPILPRQYIRIRTCVILAFGIAVLVLVVTLRDIQPDLGRPRIPPSPLSPAASAANQLSKPKPVASDGDGGDKPTKEPEPEIQRSFEEPDFALLSGQQPHTIGCDVPVDWRGKDGAPPPASVNDDENGVLVFLGVFSAADKKRRRDL
jgi:hypothetical protein